MAPVEWKKDWPMIVPPGSIVQDHYPIPLPQLTKRVSNPYNGHIPFTENFNATKNFNGPMRTGSHPAPGSLQLPALDPSLVFLRTPKEKWYDLKERKGFLSMRLLPQTCSGKDNPAFLGHRQQHAEGSASTALDFRPAADNEKAGLLVFQNETHFYFICRSLSDNKPVVQLFRSANISPAGGTSPGSAETQMELIAFQQLDTSLPDKDLRLKIVAKGATYAFYYAVKKDKWLLLKDNVSAEFLSTRTAGGFVGCMYALYATSLGQPSQTKAYFDWLTCTGLAAP